MKELLLLTILLPLAGAVVVACIAPLGRSAVRMTALIVTLLTLAGAARVVYEFPADGGAGADFAVTDIAWLGDAVPSLDIRFSVGLDGLGLWMFGLSALLMVTCVLVSWESIEDRAPLFYCMLLLLEFGCLGVFTARDIILFYLFFEFTLIPLFFLIGIWGSEDRRYAAVKFFLFTLAGSVLTFLGLLAIVWWDYRQQGGGVLRFSIGELTQALAQNPLPTSWQTIVFFGLFAGFAIKVPLFPLHTWLPLAHTQAPAAGSIVLAGVLLKIGVYGFLRFNVPMLPEATVTFMPWMLTLSVVGIIYGALVALAQTDMKRLVAYSSVSHLGYCMLGLFALNPLGVQGSVLQMVNHGISTGALFAIIGMIYERYHTRQIAEYSGIARQMPWMAFFMIVFTFSSIGLPGLNGFAGEFLILIGMFQRAWADAPPLMRVQLMAIAVVGVSGVILGAWYMLWLVQRVFFGPLKTPGRHGHVVADHAVADHGDAAHGGHHGAHDDVAPSGPSVDMKLREILALAPLAVFALWIGLRPHDFLSRMEPTLTRATQAAAERVESTYAASPVVAPMTLTENQGSRPTEKITRVR
jgi:NADH-quinone oxidoreductase subunit M